MAEMENEVNITASEVADYVFCKRGWWLRQKGVLSTTQGMLDGTEKHDNIFLRMQSLRLRKYIAWGFMAVGAFIMLYIIVSQL